MSIDKELKNLIESANGEIESLVIFEDGHGFATAAFPLPKDHWLFNPSERYEAPPMPFRMGKANPNRKGFEDKITAAAKYAVRASTMNGKCADFDPDAMVRNFIVGMVGYYTEDGLSSDHWANPDPIPAVHKMISLEEAQVVVDTFSPELAAMRLRVETAERQYDALKKMLEIALEALLIIAQHRQCSDNLMGNKDVAIEALSRIDIVKK